MSKTLTEIARRLSTPEPIKKNVPEKTKEIDTTKPVPRVQLIYAFNGTGKTRLSQEFTELFPSESDHHEIDNNSDSLVKRILYYNALTEDLFYWENDTAENGTPRLKIQSNNFVDWILRRGSVQEIQNHFQSLTNRNITPNFPEKQKTILKKGRRVTVPTYPDVEFELATGDSRKIIKVSRGEERLLVWSIFYVLMKEIISISDDTHDDNTFSELEYIFIDDPVSSLDDNNLIQLAVDLAQSIKSSKSKLKFIITTHNPLFFNVLCNEFGSDEKNELYNWKSKWFGKSRLEKHDDGNFHLEPQPNDSPFAYHLHLISQLQDAIKNEQIEKYHFNLLRNILEKTATFLGYKRWEHLLPKMSDGQPDPYIKRLVNSGSHSKHSGDEVRPLKPKEKEILEELLKHVVKSHQFWQPVATDGEPRAQ